jgi:hypothetical protein
MFANSLYAAGFPTYSGSRRGQRYAPWGQRCRSCGTHGLGGAILSGGAPQVMGLGAVVPTIDFELAAIGIAGLAGRSKAEKTCAVLTDVAGFVGGGMRLFGQTDEEGNPDAVREAGSRIMEGSGMVEGAFCPPDEPATEADSRFAAGEGAPDPSGPTAAQLDFAKTWANRSKGAPGGAPAPGAPGGAPAPGNGSNGSNGGNGGKKSNTGLLLGVGAAVVAVGVGAYILLK